MGNYCSHCGTALPEEACFCSVCGARLTPAAPDAPAQPVYTQPAAPAQPANTQPAAPVKKSRVPLIIAIVAAAALLIGGTVFFILHDRNNDRDGDGDRDAPSAAAVDDSYYISNITVTSDGETHEYRFPARDPLAKALYELRVYEELSFNIYENAEFNADGTLRRFTAYGEDVSVSYETKDGALVGSFWDGDYYHELRYDGQKRLHEMTTGNEPGKPWMFYTITYSPAGMVSSITVQMDDEGKIDFIFDEHGELTEYKEASDNESTRWQVTVQIRHGVFASGTSTETSPDGTVTESAIMEVVSEDAEKMVVKLIDSEKNTTETITYYLDSHGNVCKKEYEEDGTAKTVDYKLRYDADGHLTEMLSDEHSYSGERSTIGFCWTKAD